MSEESWKRSLSLELEIKRAAGLERVVLVPGNHGERFVREQMGIDTQVVVTMSNFVGYMIEEAVRLGFRQIVLVGHPGKLVKIAAGSSIPIAILPMPAWKRWWPTSHYLAHRWSC
jgi:cobalt-precorrin-5B (C1)-methyltransferase